MKLKKGLTEKVLLHRIGVFVRMAGVGERGLAFYLLDLDKRGLFRKQGFSSTAQFALMRHQVSLRKTRELLRVARSLEDLPLIDDAFAAGTISWSAVREISRVAVAETEEEWLDLASTSSLRTIESAVHRARRGERPPQDPYGLTRTKLKVVAELAIEDHALWQAAFDRVAANSGSELDASTALLVLARSYLEKPLSTGEAGARQAFQVVYHRCTECERAWVQTEDGVAGVPVAKVATREPLARVIRVANNAQNVPVANDAQNVPVANDAQNVNVAQAVPTVKKAAGDGIDSRPANNPRELSNRIDPTRNVLTDAAKQPIPVSAPGQKTIPPSERHKPNTPAIRQKVLGRDGLQCRVPGCTNRARLVSHHVIWRSHGGATTVDNEVGLCQSCHSLIHEGALRVVGNASTGLEWLGADGDALSRFDGGTSRVRLVFGRNSVGSDPRGFFEKDTAIRSLDEVPDEVDSGWWKRYGHNFDLKGTRLLLKTAR